MTLERAQELITLQISLGTGYNRNAVTLILAEVGRTYGQTEVDHLIDSLALEQAFGIKKGRKFH